MKQKYCLLICIILFSGMASAQSKMPLFTADSMKSGNSKDIITSFFQLALNNLIGKNRELNFTTSPYAIMLKRNPDLSIDKSYKKFGPLRKLNIVIGLRLDTSFNFNGFSSGLKYALVDQTDITTSRIFVEKAKSDQLNMERDSLNMFLSDYFRKVYTPLPTDTNAKAYKDAMAFRNKVGKLRDDKPFSTFDNDFKKVVMSIVKDSFLNMLRVVLETKPDSSFKAMDLARFEALKNAMKKNFIWTIGLNDTTYKDKFQFSNISAVTEISKGIFDPEPGDNNIEFTAKAAYHFLNDTLRKDRNLKRELFTSEAGFNWIIRDRKTDRSFFETKFSGTYYHNFAGIYKTEKRDSLTLNATLRFRLVEDIWIPLEVKYDPRTGNVFGFLNIKANFTGLGSLLKQPAKK